MRRLDWVITMIPYSSQIWSLWVEKIVKYFFVWNTFLAKQTNHLFFFFFKANLNAFGKCTPYCFLWSPELYFSPVLFSLVWVDISLKIGLIYWSCHMIPPWYFTKRWSMNFSCFVLLRSCLTLAQLYLKLWGEEISWKIWYRGLL